MRDLETLTSAERAHLEVTVREEGFATVLDVRLPQGCTPESAAVNFLVADDEAVEAYISSDVQYEGSDDFWSDVFAAEPVGNTAYLVLTAESLSAALNGLQERIDEPNNCALSPASSPSSPSSLTDIEAVRASMPTTTPARVDAQDLAQRIGERVRGQQQAVGVLAQRVANHVSKVEPRRPASLFLLGPTGVGKTRTAEVLAEALGELVESDARHRFLRLDMNEYAEGARVSQLLGAPPGYVGHTEGAVLADTLRQHPRTVVLFDEIEKAHPSVLRVLMNAMDAGRLGTGRMVNGTATVDCRQAVFLFTSNLGGHAVAVDLERRQVVDQQPAVDAACRDALLTSGVAPELVGRITACVYFRPLTDDAMVEIASLAIVRLGAEFGHSVRFIDPAVVAHVLTGDRLQSLGVRPLEYVIDEYLSPVFADAIHLRGTPVVLDAGPPPDCRAFSPTHTPRRTP